MVNNKIQWFPGHMHKARKEIEEVVPKIDVIIEVLDARIPFSSENPLIRTLRGDKPVIKVLNKRDLADPAMTDIWMAHLEQEQGVSAMAITTQQQSEVNRIMERCRALAPHREAMGKNIRSMIMGIPNVGKSTIINSLAGRVIAKTGNQPAVTRQQQRINLQNGVVLSDTPGILWPKVENPHSGFRLAATGAVKDTAMDYDEVAFYTVEYLASAYPERLQERYQLDVLPDTDIELMEAIGAKRGCLRAGGRVDLHKASEVLLHDLRAGALGGLTLEKPDMIETELVQVEEDNARREEEKAAKKEARRKRYLKNKR
ncbi:ribosome biogenesis GTPase YlqF [Salinivibrio sp. MA351]|uniref:Ribosome biogenesis GTPase A n=1 Tax=Salinivibrio costicola subsp. alcaliphilus TaxID=272773 RepID=A0ABX3KMM6_SALCS|nr:MULTISPECIES: ribosome biogenesis GTPase YlqF [Salinivibrio]NUY57369.1 ribosome biogenesis GTPase YlqF [Salinivibrio sp. EAGSL]OOE91374.1 ribosome biogenesis GTPase YlqF [Salinivibrio sp. AR640]OOE92602.1 ribosome biogenesis GTPase YlqF [Salinivibrio sp. AR647]OOE97362.1 ribosome biogenesis GTPase YlqF [Salinivibrio sp. MA351]OOF03190.1 ribosome biogenesis GTPase YlqF [Salinivibrio sp. MA607]